MGHEIIYESYAASVDTRSVQAEWEDRIRHICWQEGGGMSQPIRWIDHICEDREAAYKYIERHDDGWYDQLAVKYYTDGDKIPKAVTKLEERLKDAITKNEDLKSNIHYKGVKSQYIACRTCGSKIASKFFGRTVGNKCPVCGSDMRPQSTLDRIAAGEDRVEKIKKQLKEEKAKTPKIKRD